MIERIPDMPDGTQGFRASGHVTAADYKEVLLPTLRPILEAGGKLRVLLVVASDFHEEPSGAWEDLKSAFEIGVKHWGAWERTAVVSDTECVRKGSRFFAFMMPGTVRTFTEAELDEAKGWVGSAD